MIFRNDDINNVSTFARAFFNNSGTFTEKVSVFPAKVVQSSTYGVAASSGQQLFYFMASDERLAPNVQPTFIPQLWYGYLDFSMDFTTWTAGTITQDILQAINLDVSGNVQPITLPYGTAARQPDPGTAITPTLTSCFSYSSPRPMLFNYLLSSFTFNVATFTLFKRLTFSGYRFLPC